MTTKEFEVDFSSLLRWDITLYVEGEEVMMYDNLEDEVFVLYVDGFLSTKYFTHTQDVLIKNGEGSIFAYTNHNNDITPFTIKVRINRPVTLEDF